MSNIPEHVIIKAFEKDTSKSVEVVTLQLDILDDIRELQKRRQIAEGKTLEELDRLDQLSADLFFKAQEAKTEEAYQVGLQDLEAALDHGLCGLPPLPDKGNPVTRH